MAKFSEYLRKYKIFVPSLPDIIIMLMGATLTLYVLIRGLITLKELMLFITVLSVVVLLFFGVIFFITEFFMHPYTRIIKKK